jgi:two-component system cell cycle sensor histidine kinase/response regulator CckA
MSTPAAMQGHGECILYLDDEEPLVFLVTRMLKRLGYEPHGFTKAEQALESFRNNPGKFSLVLTDLSMPGTSGIDFAQKLLADAPDAAVVIITGSVDPAAVTRAAEVGVRSVVQKPLTVEELGPLVACLLSEIRPGPST